MSVGANVTGMVGCFVGEQVTVGPGVVGKRVGWLVGSSEGGWDASRVGRIEGTMVGTGVLPAFVCACVRVRVCVSTWSSLHVCVWVGGWRGG